MNPPVTVEQLHDMWSEDSVIDKTEPGLELLKIPKLQSKYLKIMSYHNLRSKKYSSDYNKLRRTMYEYYDGDLNNPEDLKEHNLEPWLKKGIKSNIQFYLDSDPRLNELLLKKAVQDEIVDACKSIIKELNSRTYQIRSFIDWEKFTSGAQF